MPAACGFTESLVTELASDDPDSLFELVIAEVDKRLPQGTDHYTITEVVRRSRTEPLVIVASVRLFLGVGQEAGD